MLFHEWKEFILYPKDSSRIHSRTERLDTSRGTRPGRDGHYPPEFFAAGKGAAAVIPLSAIIFCDDVFESMEIDDLGRVMIWTRDKVWFLAHEGDNGQGEKLRFLPRHPPKPQLQPAS